MFAAFLPSTASFAQSLNNQTLETSGAIGAITVSGTSTLRATGNITSSYPSDITLNFGSSLTVDTNGYSISIAQNSGGNSLSGPTGAAVTFNKVGAGTLTLANKIIYLTYLNVSGGEMISGASSASTTTVTNATFSPTSFSGSVTLNAGATLKARSAFSSSGSVTLGASDSTFNTNSYDVTLSNTVSGTGALNKAGTGTLTLSGSSNNFSGGVNVQAGTVKLSSSGALTSTSTVALSSGASLDLNNTSRTIGQLSGAGNVTLGSATLTVNQSTNSELSGALSGTGGLTKSGTGTLTLSGTNTASGATTVSAGTLQIGNGGTSGSLAGNITNNATLAFNRSDASTYSGVISGSGAVTKSGGGTLTLSGINTYSGATTISAGTLKLSGSVANSAFTVAGGTLAGAGTLGALIIDDGGTLAPGNSPGTLHAGATTFASGGSYLWEINNVNGTAGADPGWDLLSITGGLTISATNADPFTIDLTSLTSGNVAGLATGFSTNASYSFTLVSTTTGISGFSTDKFYLDTSGFANTFDGTWALALANSGNDLALTYTSASAVPEPSTYALLAGFAALGLVTWRRRVVKL